MNKKCNSGSVFQEWMETNQMSIRSLANTLSMPYHRVYKIQERNHVPESFKWRFAQVFGLEEARIAFGEDGEPSVNAEPDETLQPA